MRRRLLAIGLTALTVLLAATTAAAGPRGSLSHEGHWLIDRDGRVVILHGLNMVYKVGSYRPADSGFGADDARFLRRQGFNTVRLGIIYKGLEPQPPGPSGRARYSDAYLRSIASTERSLARQGIFTLLDFHQDLYNERFQGEGWPDWQVLDDGVPSEPQAGFPTNYLVNQGLNRAFDNFWANAAVGGRGLQDAYAAAWAQVARKFRSRSHVLGYDLLNEPWPGSAFGPDGCMSASGCSTFDLASLTPFNERVIRAIRRVDRKTLAFYEPLVTFDFGADSLAADTGDRHAGFSFHVYCLPETLGGPGSGPECEPLEDTTFSNADRQSAETGDVPILTEFGATDDTETLERVLRLADRHMVSWQEWHYCDCSDPTTTGPGVQSLVIDPAKPPRGTNVDRGKLAVLSRPYPRAVAGTPSSWSFDPATRRFELRYATRVPHGQGVGRGRLARSELTEVFVPSVQYPDGYRARARGAEVVSARGSRVLRLRRTGAGPVSVSVVPR